MKRSQAIEALRALARYKTHGGYVWAAAMDDGELVCVPCVRENYRTIYKATRDELGDGWQCAGIANSGDAETSETCAHCHETIWEIAS